MTLTLVLNSGMWELWCAGLTLATHSLTAQQGHRWGTHIKDCTALRWDWRCVGPAFPNSGRGRSLEHGTGSQARRHPVSEPWGCLLADTMHTQTDVHSHCRSQSPPHQAGKSSNLPADRRVKKTFLALSRCLFVPLGFLSFVKQARGRKNPEGLLLYPSLDRQGTRGTRAGKRQQPGGLAVGNVSRAAPPAAPQLHDRGGKQRNC